MKIYSVSQKSQLSALWTIVFIGGIWIIFLLYIYEPTREFYFYLKFSIPLYLILLCPVLYLHFQYLSYNKNTILNIDFEKQIICIDNGNEIIIIGVKDIDRIDFYLTSALIVFIRIIVETCEVLRFGSVSYSEIM